MKARITECLVDDGGGSHNDREFNLEVTMPNGEFVFLHDTFPTLGAAMSFMWDCGMDRAYVEVVMLDEEESEDEVP